MKKNVKLTLGKMLESNGKLVPSVVLDRAKNKKSPLHGEFEWDDARAGHQYRLWQARSLIKQYSVTIKERDKKLVHVPPRVGSKNREGEYKPISSVVSVQSEFERALSEARKTLRAAKANVELLEQFAEATGEESNTALLAAVMRSLDTADRALERLH